MAQRQPVVSWPNRIRHSLERERITDAQFRVGDDDPDNPYWTYEEVEQLHAEIAQREIRMTPRRDIPLLGTLAIADATFSGLANGVNFGDLPMAPNPIVRVLGGRINTAFGGTYYPAAGPVSIAEWYQLEGTAARVFAVVGSKIYFNGFSLKLTYIVEPTLNDFQTNELALPAAATLDSTSQWVHQQMIAAADWSPIGRV